MFTGIIQSIAPVASVEASSGRRRLLIPLDAPDVKPGESIAISGVCLTVAQITPAGLVFDVIDETLQKTNLGSLRAGDWVNIERSLRVGDRIDGHFVQGHVDGTGELLHSVKSDGETRLTIRAPQAVVDYLVPKGSICVEGVSLTIARLEGDVFDVALIPTTLEMTNLGARAAGARLNLEADVMSKTIVHYLRQREMRK